MAAGMNQSMMAMVGGPGGGGGAAAPAAPAAVGGMPLVTTPPPGARRDPFAPWWDNTPPPPPAISLVPALRLASRNPDARPVEAKVEVQEVPNRRVAGIVTGVGVYALVEGPEGTTVVRPGDMLGEYRVENITPTSVVLKRTVGNQIYTQVVPLTDVGSVTQSYNAGGTGGIPGMPSMGSGPGGRGRRGGAMGGGGGQGANVD